MQKLFIIGSTDGQIIASMKRMMQKIYPIAFNTQYRQLHAVNYNLFAAQDAEQIKRHIDVTRPSDYWFKDSISVDSNKTDTNTRESIIRACFEEVIDPFVESIER